MAARGDRRKKEGIMERWNDGRMAKRRSPRLNSSAGAGVQRGREDYLPICLSAMADPHDLDSLSLFVNFVEDSIVAHSDSPIIL
jgi:hypothetical protein